MNRRVLCVDDEASVLSGFRRTLRRDVELTVAESGAAALSILETQEPFAVVLTDMRMPSMTGLQLLQQVQERWPTTVRMMLTGNNDLDTAMHAVNEGAVFRFLTKPCPGDILLANLEAAIEQYRLITAEKELLEKTVAGVVRLLTELMDLMDPNLFRRTRRVRALIGAVAKRLHQPYNWKIDLAVMLARIGEVTLPPALRERLAAGQPLSEEEADSLLWVPTIGARLLRHIPRLEPVALLVEALGEEDIEPAEAPYGTGLARTVDAFVRCEEAGFAAAIAVDQLRKHGGYDEAVLQALADLHPEVSTPQSVPAEEIVSLTIRALAPGMVLLEDLCLCDGRTLMSAGHELTATMIERVLNFHRLNGLREPVRVRKPGTRKDGRS